jgi:uncharacterized protein (TIGR02118 family)
MIRLSLMYTAKPDTRFDWEYYLGPHLELARRLLDSRGLVRTEIDRGVGSLPPGAPPVYHAIGRLFFRTMEQMETALTATAGAFIADERNHTDAPSVVQSEVLDDPNRAIS